MILKPIRPDSMTELILRTKVSFRHFTKCPRIKYTPSSTVTAEPVCAAVVECVVAEATFAAYDVVCAIVVFAVIFSELENASVALSEPAAIYCKCKIGCAVVVASENPITFALTPEVTPVIITGSVTL